MRLVELQAMNLEPGMFVAEIDRPWLETPFSLQGFVVRDYDDIEFISQYVERVFVDAEYKGARTFLRLATEPTAPNDIETLRIKAEVVVVLDGDKDPKDATDTNLAVRQASMARLRDEIGVRVSIDDFGTGFSSLAYFRDLPADEIKIDKCFVMPMLESDKDYAIVKAVIDLAHNFSLKVVAEGVETEEIARRLANMRCDVLQGYVFDAPLMIDDFEKRYLF